jgi:hypothetical protein
MVKRGLEMTCSEEMIPKKGWIKITIMIVFSIYWAKSLSYSCEAGYA